MNLRTASLAAAASLALSVGLATAAPMPNDADARRQIEAGYATFIKGVKTKDVKAITSLAAPGFTDQEMGMPPLDAKHATQMLEQQFQMTKSVKAATCKVQKLTVSGNTAHATADIMMDAIIAGPDKKDHRMVMTGTDNDTWVKIGSTWKIKTVKAVSEKATMDGKPFNPTAPPPQPGGGRKAH